MVEFFSVDQCPIDKIIFAEDICLVPRNIAKNADRFGQVIPYIVVQYQNQVLVYQLSTSGGESRLHDHYSVGLGRHMGLEDVVTVKGGINISATVERAAAREMMEELSLL